MSPESKELMITVTTDRTHAAYICQAGYLWGAGSPLLPGGLGIHTEESGTSTNIWYNV